MQYCRGIYIHLKFICMAFEGIHHDTFWSESLQTGGIFLNGEKQRIKELETTNRFYREPVYTDEDYRLSIKNFSMDKLLDAYARLIDRLNRREADIEPKKVMKERFSVSNRISYIAQRIFSEKKLDLFSLFDEDFTRLEIVNTFLALLELVKRQVIKTTQDDTFGDIYLELAEGALPINLEGDNEFEQH